jgi:hypothetical protein
MGLFQQPSKGKKMNTIQPDPTAFKPMKITAGRDIDVGYQLEPVVKKVMLDKMRLYRSQWPRIRNWHNDYTIAQKWGVDQPLVFASQIMEYFGELLIKFFGTGYLGGTLSLAIIKSAWPDDRITVQGIVREKAIEDERVRLILDVWCENQQGEKVMVGTASGLVP